MYHINYTEVCSDEISVLFGVKSHLAFGKHVIPPLFAGRLL